MVNSTDDKFVIPAMDEINVISMVKTWQPD